MARACPFRMAFLEPSALLQTQEGLVPTTKPKPDGRAREGNPSACGTQMSKVTLKQAPKRAGEGPLLKGRPQSFCSRSKRKGGKFTDGNQSAS